MLHLLKQSWAQVQDELRSAAGDAAHTAWLRNLRPVLMERGIVYLEADNRLVRDRVQRLFLPLLQRVLSAEIGTEVQVVVQDAPRAVDLAELEVSPQRPIVDDGNRTAWLVLENLRTGRELPATLFFFHGPSGVGKTFLLRRFREQHDPHDKRDGRDQRGRRITTFELLALFKAFQAVHREQRLHELREELVAPPVLVLDEFHRTAGKPAMQTFLLDVLQAREAQGSITLLSSRWHPKEIHGLDASLQSVLLSGFVAKLDPPGPLGRLRYLRALEGAPSRNGRAEAIEGLAQRLSGTWPELRMAWATSRHGAMPPKYLQLIDPSRVFQRVQARVCERLGVTPDELLGKSQSRKLSMARKVLAFLCVQEGLSRAEVGRFLSRRTRAAISYMTKSLAEDMAESPEVRAIVEGLL